MSKITRLMRHLFSGPRKVRMFFPSHVICMIHGAINDSVKGHSGEIVVAMEGGMPWHYLLKGNSAQQRALDVFSQLRVWDTEHNNGVLVYILIAEARVEVIADRGLRGLIDEATLRDISKPVEDAFSVGKIENRIVECLGRISSMLKQHFPVDDSSCDASSHPLLQEPVLL